MATVATTADHKAIVLIQAVRFCVLPPTSSNVDAIMVYHTLGVLETIIFQKTAHLFINDYNVYKAYIGGLYDIHLADYFINIGVCCT